MKKISATSSREQVTFWWDDNDIYAVLYQDVQLDIYSASTLKQQSMGRHVAPLRHIYY